MNEAAELFRAMAVLGVVIALVLALGWGAKRLNLGGGGARQTGKRLAVIETLVVDPRHRVVLLKLDGEERLLALGPQGGAWAPHASRSLGHEPEQGASS